MPQRVPQDRPFRVRNLALVAGVIAVSLAARSQTQGTTPPQPPTSAKPTPATTPAVQSKDPNALQDTLLKVDSLAGDSAAVQALDSASALPQQPLDTTSMPAPAAAAPAAWPVDPVSGQTIINGIPVVGKVFIMQKTDGVVKVETVAQDRQNEALPPEAAVVGSVKAPGLTQTRRHRGIMVQATLWAYDKKAKSTRDRFYGPTTSGASLGQQY